MEKQSYSTESKAVGCISFPLTPSEKFGCENIVYGCESGVVYQFKLKRRKPDTDYFSILPNNETDKKFELNAGPIVALGMDTKNAEGLVGTQDGSIFYIKFDGEDLDQAGIPLVRKMTPSMERIGQIMHVPDQSSASH